MENSAHDVSELANEISARIIKLPAHDTNTLRNLRRQFSKQLADAEPQAVISLALKLSKMSVVPRFFAYELIQHHRGAHSRLKAKSLEQLASGNQSWETVDAFASYLSGPAWRGGQISDSAVKRWARSKDSWWRRTAVVSTVPLNSKARGGTGDTARTLMICEIVLADRDDMVVKAVSWALRELSKRDPQSVRKFLTMHQLLLAPRVIREVNNKLETGLKNPRR